MKLVDGLIGELRGSRVDFGESGAQLDDNGNYVSFDKAIEIIELLQNRIAELENELEDLRDPGEAVMNDY